MNISHQVKAITSRVKDHRGYTDMIFDLSVFIDYTDNQTNSNVGYQLFKQFDTEKMEREKINIETNELINAKNQYIISIEML